MAEYDEEQVQCDPEEERNQSIDPSSQSQEESSGWKEQSNGADSSGWSGVSDAGPDADAAAAQFAGQFDGEKSTSAVADSGQTDSNKKGLLERYGDWVTEQIEKQRRRQPGGSTPAGNLMNLGVKALANLMPTPNENKKEIEQGKMPSVFRPPWKWGK